MIHELLWETLSKFAYQHSLSEAPLGENRFAFQNNKKLIHSSILLRLSSATIFQLNRLTNAWLTMSTWFLLCIAIDLLASKKHRVQHWTVNVLCALESPFFSLPSVGNNSSGLRQHRHKISQNVQNIYSKNIRKSQLFHRFLEITASYEKCKYITDM